MSAAQVILQCYIPLIDCNHPSFYDENYELKIPAFSKKVILDLFSEAIELLNIIPTLVDVDDSAIIVGDLHGNILDLIRIIRKNGLPGKHSYVFLGDYVDRGEFSVEVLTLLFALQIYYPDKIVILRGNHELKHSGPSYGFAEEVKSCYGDLDIFEKAHTVFQYLSLAAIIGNAFFCVHGGISEKAMRLENISSLRKPIDIERLTAFEKSMVDDLLWSDPVDSHVGFTSSLRGYGHQYGILAAFRFFHETGLKKIIRGHTMVEKGVHFMMGQSIITVFSSGCYRPSKQNSPGFLKVKGHNIRPYTLKSRPQLIRKTTHFIRPVMCTNLAGLQSGRRIGPGIINRYWSSRRSMRRLPAIPEVQTLPAVATPPIVRQKKIKKVTTYASTWPTHCILQTDF